MIEALRTRNAAEVFDEHLVTDEELSSELANGSLMLDTRARDALRLAPGALGAPPSPVTLADDACIAAIEDRLSADGPCFGRARRLLSRGSTGWRR
jgi:hypothetical protein